MTKSNSNKGISIVEALVALVVIGIGFVAILQVSAFTISSMDRSMEKTKLNLLSEMIMEDMIGNPEKISSYDNFNETCSYSTKGGTNLHEKQKDKWRNKLAEKNHIRIKNASGSYKERKIPCFSQDSKKTFVSTRNKSTAGRVNFITGKGKRKKYLSLVIK